MVSVLPDYVIRQLATTGMINQFEEESPKGKVSYGLSSYGYDIRVGHKFKICDKDAWEHINNQLWQPAVIDPKKMDNSVFKDFEGDFCVIPSHGFALAESVEDFNIPRDVLAICLGKSTYARCGLVVNVTPLEPEWRGHITLELSNTTPLPIKVYANEGIAQIVFLQASQPCHKSYEDKHGKYQNQKGITLPFVE